MWHVSSCSGVATLRTAIHLLLTPFRNNNNNNNNNNHDNVYGAVIMTKVIARVNPVHLMKVDRAPGGCQPSDQANRLGLRVRRKLAATVHIHYRQFYFYSARRRTKWTDQLRRDDNNVPIATV